MSNGESKCIKGKKFILATHTLGNCHVLFNSNIGNSSGTLGKFLMDHLKFFVMGRVNFKTEAHRMGFETATSLHFHDHADRDQYAAGRLLVRENAGPTPDEISFYSGYWGDKLKEEIKSTFSYYLTLGGLLEQLPYEFNHTRLSDSKKNEFGDPAIFTSWELGRDYEYKAFKNLHHEINELLKKAGAKNLSLGMGLAHSGHYSGGHRMGNNSTDSVVDSNLKIHDMENLYLLGTGNLPTCSTNNPTLTSVALTFYALKKW